MGDKSIFYDILDPSDFQSLTTDLSNVLKEFGYNVNIVENGLNYNSIKISW